MNTALLRITGRPGEVSARTVRNLLNGTTRQPIGRTRAALEDVFGCPITDLGFGTPRTTAPPEDPVLRRTFITSSAAVAAAAVASPPAAAAPQRVGATDVARLESGLGRLTEIDDRQGGHHALERAALAGATAALALTRENASARTRGRLFAIASDYTCWAAWSSIDARRLDHAETYLDRALSLAGLGSDTTAALRVWNFRSMLAYQRGDGATALAAGHAAQTATITRRDPLFASLAHARTAVAHSHAGDRQAALRSLGRAEGALGRAREVHRPSWADFYGRAELDALTAIVQDNVGLGAEAEASSYRALAQIPARFRRNRALATARLALAQLHQGEAELACTSAASVFTVMDGDPLPARMRTLLGDFHRDLLTAAPGSAAAINWTDNLRTNWSRP